MKFVKSAVKPLKSVFLDGANAIRLDVSPLAECRQLESAVLLRQAVNIHLLKSLPRLRALSYYENRRTQPQPATDFWQAYDSAVSVSQQRPLSVPGASVFR